ncbi:MAG: hypothetical protein C0591_05500 [Marinilabiliales bacterium]|nr:MAG: hypothetical protein C0591_05500 [Marinilabiliales bacterium]
MKKIVVLVVLSILISLGGYAQNNKRTSAYMYLKNGELAKAKEAIDEATQHEKTMHDAKTWLYAGEIYYQIAAEPAMAELLKEPDAAMKSYEALQKAKKYDEKDQYSNEISIYLANLTNQFYKQGGLAFQDGDYNVAIDNFKIAYNIAQVDNRFDTIAAFNIGMAGVLGDDPEASAEYLAKCVDVNFEDPRVYMFYNRAVKQLGDTARAIEILQLGRDRFPQELSLLLEEAQLYLERGENEKLQVSLLQAIEQDPENSNLFFLLGKTYDDEGNIPEAEKYYQKAADLNPDFFEAYYNMGAVYVNKAAEIQAKANDLPLDQMDEYAKLTEKANENLAKAVPHLEKALEIKPDDAPTIAALKETYARLKMDDKLEKLNQQ